jgi:hypothetical protein
MLLLQSPKAETTAAEVGAAANGDAAAAEQE